MKKEILIGGTILGILLLPIVMAELDNCKGKNNEK